MNLNGWVAENLISVGGRPHTRRMLTTLRISGLAIVDQAEVVFGPGLNVLTGETGAGKSILVQALHLALGGRMPADALREGAEEAVVEALFELSPRHPVLERLLAAGLPVPAEGGEVLVRRSAARGGRGRAFVNGALCTVGMLEACARARRPHRPARARGAPRRGRPCGAARRLRRRGRRGRAPRALPGRVRGAGLGAATSGRARPSPRGARAPRRLARLPARRAR